LPLFFSSLVLLQDVKEKKRKKKRKKKKEKKEFNKMMMTPKGTSTLGPMTKAWNAIKEHPYRSTLIGVLVLGVIIAIFTHSSASGRNLSARLTGRQGAPRKFYY
jgi:hypothetical protein